MKNDPALVSRYLIEQGPPDYQMEAALHVFKAAAIIVAGIMLARWNSVKFLAWPGKQTPLTSTSIDITLKHRRGTSDHC